MIDQIRHLQDQRSFEPFAIELSSGRVIQIYDSRSVATSEQGTIGVLHGSAFKVIPVDKIVSVSSGVHPVEKERLDKFRERFSKK